MSSFSSYQRIKEKIEVMNNSSYAWEHGEGWVILKFISGNSITLQNVHHVLKIRKNLISGSLLNLQGFQLVFEFNKFVISKNNVFVGKGYVCDYLFKLNIIECVVSNSCNSSNFCIMLVHVMFGMTGLAMWTITLLIVWVCLV